ncbi:Ribosomal RNA large subunit methyltransferase G [Streptomyces cyaneofuscatus]
MAVPLLSCPPTWARSGLTTVNHAGIFCADRLDIGTRFFLKHLPTRGGAVRVVDLGCGNGVLGLSAAVANPQAHITFVDESYGAVASAEETFRAGAPGLARRPTSWSATDSPTSIRGSVDLVLNNPPFHSHLATTDATASPTFADARTALRQGAASCGSSATAHLSYHTAPAPDLRQLHHGRRRSEVRRPARRQALTANSAPRPFQIPATGSPVRAAAHGRRRRGLWRPATPHA